jgi:hypothetical protein
VRGSWPAGSASVSSRADGATLRPRVHHPACMLRTSSPPLPPLPPHMHTPGSMYGAREVVAKAVALECMRGAHRQQRRCYLYSFRWEKGACPEGRQGEGPGSAPACGRMHRGTCKVCPCCSGPGEVMELELGTDPSSLKNLLAFLAGGFGGGTGALRMAQLCFASHRRSPCGWVKALVDPVNVPHVSCCWPIFLLLSRRGCTACTEPGARGARGVVAGVLSGGGWALTAEYACLHARAAWPVLPASEQPPMLKSGTIAPPAQADILMVRPAGGVWCVVCIARGAD